MSNLKKFFLKQWKNEDGYIFPLTSFILLIALLLTFHQIEQFHHQQRLNELSEEQYFLEMLYQKAIISLKQEKNPPPPYDYVFPDGSVHITLLAEEDLNNVFQMNLETIKGSSRTINLKYPE